MGIPNPRIKRVTRSGIPRKISMYVAANQRYGRTVLRRMSANNKPKESPPAKPKMVKMRVFFPALRRMSGNCSTTMSHLNIAPCSRPQSTTRATANRATTESTYTAIRLYCAFLRLLMAMALRGCYGLTDCYQSKTYPKYFEKMPS